MIPYGFLRETTADAEKDGFDKEFNLCRTGLEIYLAKIFPNIHDWIHDKAIPNLKDLNNKARRIRPDYRSEALKMIVEFDGLPHYNQVLSIIKDEENTKIYETNGYKVVRIPYFIQLSKSVVKQLFQVDIQEKLFDESIPSLGIKNLACLPASLCPLGVQRMAKEKQLRN